MAAASPPIAAFELIDLRMLAGEPLGMFAISVHVPQ
jgi:hypothetical protein